MFYHSLQQIRSILLNILSTLNSAYQSMHTLVPIRKEITELEREGADFLLTVYQFIEGQKVWNKLGVFEISQL